MTKRSQLSARWIIEKLKLFLTLTVDMFSCQFNLVESIMIELKKRTAYWNEALYSGSLARIRRSVSAKKYHVSFQYFAVILNSISIIAIKPHQVKSNIKLQTITKQ